MNSIEKAPRKIEGEVTAETVLSQCRRMSNDSIHAHFEYMPHVNGLGVRVLAKGIHIYSDIHYTDNDCGKSLADILQDLISIEYEYEQKESSKVES